MLSFTKPSLPFHSSGALSSTADAWVCGDVLQASARTVVHGEVGVLLGQRVQFSLEQDVFL